MPQRWERELRRLNGLRAPDGLRARVDEGPKGDALPPDPGSRQRLIAGVVAVVVFISAGAFAWRALQPAPTTPSVAGRASGVDGTILWPERTQAALDATQSRADAGDPDVAWRLDPKAVATRFAEDVMGWRTPDGTYIVDVAASPSPSGSIEVSLDRYAIPCPSPMPGGPPTGCPPPYEGEQLTLVQAGTVGERGIWSVAEVRASGFDLALHAGDLLSNGDSVSGHVTFPSTADAVPDFAIHRSVPTT